MLKYLFFLFTSIPAFAQKWTPTEWATANTAATVSVLTPEEKELIRYINLARLYPAKFAEQEVKDYVGPEIFGDYLKTSPYKQSLYKMLLTSKPLPPLQFDQEMYVLAKCFAIESGSSGTVGHTRKNCVQGDLRGECCSYGYDKGLDVALTLLIDHDVPSLGHRDICLSSNFKSVGIKIATHVRYINCAVLDFR